MSSPLKAIAPETRDEWFAVWSALAQFVENNDPEEAVAISEEERAQWDAARAILSRFDGEMVALAR